MAILLKKRKRSKFFIGVEISKDDSYGEILFRYEIEINKKQYLELIQDLLSLTFINCVKKDIKTACTQDNIEENIYTKYIIPSYKAEELFSNKCFINEFYNRANLALSNKIQDCKKEDLANIGFYVLAPRRILNHRSRKKFCESNFDKSILIKTDSSNDYFEYRIYNKKHINSYIEALNMFKKNLKKTNKYYKIGNSYKMLDVYIYTLNIKEITKMMKNIKLPYHYLYDSPHPDRLLAYLCHREKINSTIFFEINIPTKLIEKSL